MRVGMWVVAVALVVSACSAEPSVSADQLYGEYVRSAEVKNDRFTGTGSDADRIANFAAHYGGSEELMATLLSTFECGNEEPTSYLPSNQCDLNRAVTNAAREFAGPDAEPLGRSVVVRHDDGSLELVTLYVVKGTDRTVLIDENGRTYTGLEDFQANNELLTSDDTMLTLRDITSVPGEGDLVAVAGHTPPSWPWWLLGGLGGAALVAAVLFHLYRRAEARAEAAFDEGSVVEQGDQ